MENSWYQNIIFLGFSLISSYVLWEATGLDGFSECHESCQFLGEGTAMEKEHCLGPTIWQHLTEGTRITSTLLDLMEQAHTFRKRCPTD